MPAARIIQIGDTPKAQMSKAATTGIHILYRLTLAVFAMVKHGAAIRATTAGRMPMKIFST